MLGAVVAHSAQKGWTVEQFLEWEAAHNEPFEYVGGVVRATTGGTIAHAQIKGNVHALLKTALRGGPCRAFVDDPKVVTETASSYPDVVVTCAPVGDDEDRIREPALIVEVLSKSSENHDRGDKWLAYRTLPSLQHYMLIAQDQVRAEVFSRTEDGWSYRIIDNLGGRVELSAIDGVLALADIYEDTSLRATRETG